ncbi:MAG: Glu/Leu/Phe/Val dehydrogenase [Gammaproteobacteria bacterium]|nr:Glu/Leu/Phe/Val dehydrogenase [Gammaproteobacteria bacterium]
MLQKVIYKHDLFQTSEALQFGDIHIKTDPATGLRAIIAIHNTRLGPALGGCRFVSYESADDALLDAMRLAQGMSYKAAMSGIAHGGGKSVIVKPDVVQDRALLFRSFGQFVDSLSGRYITAVDSGTNVNDMDVIASQTKHVVSTSSSAGGKGDPSPYTALGVLHGIQAAVLHRLHKDSLEGVHVAIQGAGNVGYHLAKQLSSLGVKITICDPKSTATQRFSNEFDAVVVNRAHIYDVACDVFAPCARGAILDANSVARLKAVIVAGGANNQLATPEVAQQLYDKNILYAPDYVINAGGLIHVSLDDENLITQKVSHIRETLMGIFERSASEKQPTSRVADRIAQEIIDQAG